MVLDFKMKRQRILEMGEWGEACPPACTERKLSWEIHRAVPAGRCKDFLQRLVWTRKLMSHPLTITREIRRSGTQCHKEPALQVSVEASPSPIMEGLRRREVPLGSSRSITNRDKLSFPLFSNRRASVVNGICEYTVPHRFPQVK